MQGMDVNSVKKIVADVSSKIDEDTNLLNNIISCISEFESCYVEDATRAKANEIIEYLTSLLVMSNNQKREFCDYLNGQATSYSMMNDQIASSFGSLFNG